MTQVTTGASSPGATIDRAWLEAFCRRRGEPEWLLGARLAAWQRYESLPLPTQRDEAWKRTDLRSLDLERLVRPVDGRAGAAAPGMDAAVGESSGLAGLLVLHNGTVERCQLDERLEARGVRFMSLAEAVHDVPELVRDHLTGVRLAELGKFDALGEALWEDGVFLYVPSGQAVEAPFEVVHWNDGGASALSRSLIVADESAELTIVDAYASPADQPESLGASRAVVVARQAARVRYAFLQQRDEQSWNFNTLLSEQERDSAVTWLMLSLGGRTSRIDLTAQLDGQGAEADLIGVVFGDGRQHFDLHSLQNHVGSDTRSDLVLKVALRDRATSNFTGLIRVGLEALRTSSNQENRNLLLSGEAKADSDPQLEILNSDVTRCGHGATVGPVDEEMIFYLMTRGLTKPEAQRLIVEGFFEPILAQLPLESIRERLWASIHGKLER